MNGYHEDMPQPRREVTMSVEIPRWLADMVDVITKDSQNRDWPNGVYPHTAFRATELICECGEDPDGQMSLLQLLINEVEQLQAIVAAGGDS